MHVVLIFPPRNMVGHVACDTTVLLPMLPPIVTHVATHCHQVIAAYPNVCQQLHMPAQSGSTSCLQRMRRGYSRDAYVELVDRVRAVLKPQVALSTDIIAGVEQACCLLATRGTKHAI